MSLEKPLDPQANGLPTEPLYSAVLNPGFIKANMSKIQGLLKASPTVFKDVKLMKNTDLSVNFTSEMLD